MRPLFSVMRKLTFVAPEVGACNSAYAAAFPIPRKDAELYKGTYLYPVGTITRPLPQAEDEKLGKELMDTSNVILQDLGVL